MKRRLHYWTREDTILALDLYLRLPDDEVTPDNAKIEEVAANCIGVSSHALCVKIKQFRPLDTEKDGLEISKPTHSSQMVRNVWDEFSEDETALKAERDSIIGDDA